MVRYKSKQSIKNLEQYLFLSTKSANLRMNTILQTRIQTASRDNMTRMHETTRTKPKLKRKLLVYKKDDKFYIDHSAAYALKLTNIRAIMTENPHLIEISLETLYKFQNSENIEIEYQELNKEKEVGTRKDDLTDILEELEQGEYGIGIHGIDKGSNEEKQNIASNISSKGLNINNNSKTILSTSISFGTNEETQQLSQEIIGYKIGNGTKVNAVIAVPLSIQNEDGEKIFLGFPDENKRTAGQQYEEHCILDRICTNLKKVPPEFILGYYYENSDGSENFIRNSKHYANISQEEREYLYRELYSNMDDIAKSYNDLIASGNVEQLNIMKERIQQLGWNAYMIDNAMTLAQKNKEQAMTKTAEKSKTRRIILEASQENGKTSPDKPQADITKSRREILQAFCAKIKLSDLSIAKETLREGLEEPEINYEGKEV